MDGLIADLDINRVETKANIQFPPEAKTGSYIIIHEGYGISILDIDDVIKLFTPPDILERLTKKIVSLSKKESKNNGFLWYPHPRYL